MLPATPLPNFSFSQPEQRRFRQDFPSPTQDDLPAEALAKTTRSNYIYPPKAEQGTQHLRAIRAIPGLAPKRAEIPNSAVLRDLWIRSFIPQILLDALEKLLFSGLSLPMTKIRTLLCSNLDTLLYTLPQLIPKPPQFVNTVTPKVLQLRKDAMDYASCIQGRK